MKSKKMSKKELKEAIQGLINTVVCDNNYTDNCLVYNQVWCDSDYDEIELDKSGRVILLKNKVDQEHLIRELIQLRESV